MSFGKTVVTLDGLPVIGGFVSLALALVVPALVTLPFAGVVMGLAWLFGAESWIAFVGMWLAASVFSATTVGWLHMLRDEHGVDICLPIPFISIPWLWFLWPAAVSVLVGGLILVIAYPFMV